MIATPILGMAVTLAAGWAPATAADELAIRSITVKPGTPVVGPTGSVKVVVEVMARGATAVSVRLEPGRTGPVTPNDPETPPSPGVQQPPVNPSTPGNVVPGAPAQPAQAPAQTPAHVPAQAPAASPQAVVPARPQSQAHAPSQVPAQVKTPAPAQASGQVPTPVKASAPPQAPAKPPAQAQTPSQVPPQVKPAVPAQVPAKVPAKVPAQVPGQASAQVPAQVKTPAPAQAPAKIPAPTQAAGAPTAAPPAAALNAHAAPHRAMRATAAQVPGTSRDRSEWETWLFLPERPLSRWYPSGPWTVTATARNAEGNVVTYRTIFFLKRQTALEGVNVVRSDNQVRITGTLLRVDPLGRVDYRPFEGQEIALAFRPSGSGTWRTMGTAVTDKNGWFSSRHRGMGDGVWRAEYAGTGHYAGEISADKHP
ncbi:hypothetical protein GCM10023194_55590 [Planotetraspora phitsanulokensis]